MANNKYTYKFNPLYIVIAAFICLVAIAASLLLNAYAKYVTSDSADDSARVAKFTITDTGSMYEDSFALEVDPTQTDAIANALNVVNNSEVAVNCLVTVNSTANLPLKFTWTDKNDSTQTSTAKAGEAATLSLSPNGDIGDYDLTVSWDTDTEDNKLFIYRRQVDSLTLTVICEQID